MRTDVRHAGHSSRRRWPAEVWPPVVVVLFPVLVVSLAGGWHLLSHPFWLDELFTYHLATSRSLPALFRALAAGVDMNPPALHLLLRYVAPLAGGAGPTGYRVVTFCLVVVATLFIYGTLRPGFGRLPAAAGALVLWGSPMVASQAFEARFYPLWLAALAGFIYFRSRQGPAGGRWYVEVAVAASAVVVCTTHYFGIISLALVVAGDAAVGRRRLGEVFRRNLSALAGPVALACCLPLLVSQREATPVATWLLEPTWADVRLGFQQFLMTPGQQAAFWLWPAVAVYGVGRWSSVREALGALGSHGGLLATGLMLPAIFVFSFLVQPAQMGRYAIVAFLAAAPLVAAARSRATISVAVAVKLLPTSLRLVAVAGLFVGALTAHWTIRSFHDGQSAALNTALLQLDAAAGAYDGPILFGGWAGLMALQYERPGLAGRFVLLDRPNDVIAPDDKMARLTRDLARVVLAHYPQIARLEQPEDVINASNDRLLLCGHGAGLGWFIRQLQDAGYALEWFSGEVGVARSGSQRSQSEQTP